MIGESLLQRLDAKAFLGFDVWEFSLRSLPRAYGRLFMRAVMLRHPLRALAGLLAYRNQTRPLRQSQLATVGVGAEPAWIEELAAQDWVVGMGFCEKPLSPPCPVGRFNHRCLALERPAELLPACRACHIREVALHALPAGASMHILTSAEDIAHDLLLPSLNGNPPHRAVLQVCPFSVGPISLAFTICGLKAWVFSYHQGDCRDYPTWLRADTGTKLEQTFLPEPAHRRLITLLQQVAARRNTLRTKPASCYRQSGHFYVPDQLKK